MGCRIAFLEKRRYMVRLSLVIAPVLLWAQPEPTGSTSDALVAQRAERLFEQLPPIQYHEEELKGGGRTVRRMERENYRQIDRERIAGKWFAALVSTDPGDLNEIKARFPNWKVFVDFILRHEALVELWAYTDGGWQKARRVSATELAELRRQPRDQPLFVTLTFREAEGGGVVKRRVEFGFGAAAEALSAQQAYSRQRALESAMRRILATRETGGKFCALAQWQALQKAIENTGLVITENPATPGVTDDLFVAAEYGLDENGYFSRVVRLWREREVVPRVVREADGNYTQVLTLARAGEKRGREVRAFRADSITGELSPVRAPLLGQDAIELRLVNPATANPGRWNVLEFGEPALVRQTALAEFSLVNAYLEKRRKEVALTRSKLDLYMEPVFAGLNIGCGLAAVPFPVGTAARLGYHAAVTPWLIPPVPKVKQMRELMRLVAAREKVPELKTKPARFLNAADLVLLKQRGATISDAELNAYLERIQDEDIRAMLRLARMEHLDLEFTNLLNIFAESAKVSGWSDEPGPQRDVLNSIYFSVNGDINIKNIIAILAGAPNATPHAGVSLHDLSRGTGPPEAWLQFLDATVDIRAVANTVSRLLQSDRANKELNMPFPYATRMSDIAAYEIRIFGYPLFMYYKRGLLKNDYAAFQNDYAYGLITTRIVEHFKTRYEMDEEIRAGRMTPLGFVRVLDPEGGWKESNLAVFAHRIPSGKHQGKTAIIIYGLRAYAEQSRLMRREYQRLKQYEQALEQGGVIEQVIDTDNDDLLPEEGLEPVIYSGADASVEQFSALLGNLLEWRRVLRRSALGIANTPGATTEAEQVRRSLEALGLSVDTGAGDPLVGVDMYNSSFVFRKRIEGHWRTIKMVRIPGREEIRRELGKAEEGQAVEDARRQAIAGGEGIALLSSVRHFNGEIEAGPLLRDGEDRVLETGVRTNLAALESIFAQISRLPVIDRARLKAHDYACSLVELDVDGSGRRQPVFLTLEFPLDRQLERIVTNTLSGERELEVYQDGLLMRRVSDRRILEANYEDGIETSSRTFFNQGTLREPERGALMEQTRTIEVWHRNPYAGPPEPYQPVISKVRVSYVTGETAREDFGLFELPVSWADDLYATSNRFNAYGLFAGALVWDNGKNDQDFGRPLIDKLIAPVQGKARFELTSTVRAEELEKMIDASEVQYKTEVRKRDLVKGLSRVQVSDNSAGGRLVSESWTDRLNDGMALEVAVNCEYRSDFLFGLVPYLTRKVAAGRVELRQSRTLAYDPVTRRLTAREQDYTGNSCIKVWDFRWDSPVRIESAGRRTDIQFDREETRQTSVTSGPAGEELMSARGAFDAGSGLWRLERVYWHSPGITNRVETETRSAYGMILSSQVGDAFLSQVSYDSGGIESTNRVFRRNPVSGNFDLLHRVEDTFSWNQGRRTARVRTYVEGQPHDTFQVMTDELGRPTETGMRGYPGVQLSTRISYDGVSDRVVRSEEIQNGAVRVTRHTQPAQQQPDGRWFLPVTAVPRWGLVSTQVFLLGDPLARPMMTRLENGDSIEVQEWYVDTGIARVSELVKHDGRVVARMIARVNGGTNGIIPYDVTSRYRVSFWGGEELAAEEALVRGTDLPLFTDAADERTFFDLGECFKAPLYAVDPHACQGVRADIRGTMHTNVLALHRARLQARAHPGETNDASLLHIERADLRGLLFHRVTEETYERSGQLLEELISRAPNSGVQGYSDETTFDRPRITLARFKPEYQPGWFVELPDPGSGGRCLAFTNQPPPHSQRGYRVNQDGFPETATLTEGKVYGSTGESEAARFRDSFLRRIHNVRFLERNAFMPEVDGCWSASTRTDFHPRGFPPVELERLADAQGRVRVERAVKLTTSGAPGTRTAYQVVAPEPHMLKTSDYAAGATLIPLSAYGRTNFADCDFLYLYASGLSRPELVIADRSGRKVRVHAGDSDYGSGIVPFWRIGSMHVRWLPDDIEPKQGTELLAPLWLKLSGNLLSVSVHDLARAGLDVRGLRSFALLFTNSTPSRLALSQVRALERRGVFEMDATRTEYSVAEIDHSSGLRAVLTTDRSSTPRDYFSGQKTDVLLEFNGLPIATARTRGRLAAFPHLLWLDNSDPDLARPLYAVSGLDGHFLEYCQMLRPGDAHVYVAPQTFEVPRLEIYRADVLDDELRPGIVGYGRDYVLRIPNARASGFFSRVRVALTQRVAANPFSFAGDQLLQQSSAEATDPAARRFNYLQFQDAGIRAREITQQPSPVQALIQLRDLPWPLDSSSGVATVSVNWPQLRLRLGNLHLAYAKGLIPTSPNTQAERFVDTVKEADLIVLALKLGEPAMAAELLEFYRAAFYEANQNPLLASYDAQTGTGMRVNAGSSRSAQSEATAEAQLAIADAAFYLGFASSSETNRTQWFSFGRNLLQVVLRGFRVAAGTNSFPRGIVERPVHEVRRFLGITMWPDANTYTLASNARAYLLLKRLQVLAGSRFQDPEWRMQLMAALAEQESFLKTYVIPEVERTGVVPAGLFEVQDPERQTSAIAIERWTTTEDWMLFLDAAMDMGIPESKCRRWLENLARVHGVQVGSVWGLDWRLALMRPDAISPELTARFLRMAHRLGHQPAEAFAARNLNAMRRQNIFPVALTEAPRDRVMTGGRAFSILPWRDLNAWPPCVSLFRDLRETEDYGWNLSNQAVVQTRAEERVWPEEDTDLTVFVLIAGGLYLLILGSALFWWGFRRLRRRGIADSVAESLVPERVMRRAEERWAKRVLGLQIPAVAEYWRFSNAPVEENFLMQLRAAYKLILEWRRRENGWTEDDARLVEHDADPWLNGADEFAVLIGLYMRAVIKAGAKDGFSKADVLAENEDSNHIWARLTLFFSEHLWSLGAAMRGWQGARGGPEQDDYRAEIEQSLEAMGVRRRMFGFDSRQLFNFPADPDAMDLLILQDPAKSPREVIANAALKLDVPMDHIRKVIEQYKQFKKREVTYPIHPFFVEFSKELPHFALMGLGAVVWYNQKIGDSPITSYLKLLATKLGLSAESLFWAVPLLLGMVLTATARLVRAYRFEAAIRQRERPTFLLDASLTSLFVKRHAAEPRTRGGRWRDPDAYERWAWVLRALGYFLLALTLFRLETPSFGTFLIVKGIFGPLALAEVAGILLPLTMTALSMFAQDHAQAHRWLAFLNRLNITATRPASPVWLSIKYHAQPSMPTGTPFGLVQVVVFYFLLAASFLFGAGYLCQQIFPLWFMDAYLQGNDLKLIVGGAVFGVTMVLLRHGLFLLFTSVASMLVAFPLLSIAGFVGLGQILLTYLAPGWSAELDRFSPWFWGAVGLLVVSAFFNTQISSWWLQRIERWRRSRLQAVEKLDDPRLAVVYMSGDDLSALKLTPEVLMTRWKVLRDRLDSSVVPILADLAGKPDDETLKTWFQELYDAETAVGTTLWHPVQLRVGGAGAPGLPAALGVHIEAGSEARRRRLLAAWHVRRWLVCMMSTGGHSQDTGVNLVDLALRLQQEGLSPQVAFYVIHNKYDNSPHNRPSQTPYDQGELAQRNKLCRLLCALAPGARAYCLQNWTPFGFKAGGLTGMDLAYEESLRLSTLLVLDRNATVHDLDAAMADVREAMADPNVVIIIPGRSTTNTLTPIGQSSQLVEEGHRSCLRGVLSVLGGNAGEAIGTGWGNLFACFYGRVQRALVSAHGRKMAVTSRMLRGSSFAERTEGLIGFGPHAVGISEDIWAVVQATHTALGLGLRPRFRLGRAIWHKVRETWSHAEWLSSFPRWAGGYFQMVHDPLMQRIYDFGPQSVFARELRSNSGRNFLLAPLTLLSILLMPLAIILDLSPFVQTLMVLWNCGFVLNQVLTLHALNAYLESCGFYRVTALLGAAAGGVLALVFPECRPYGPGLVLVGLLLGGFLVGFSRWLVTRVRDLLLFGPQLVLHALAQTVRLSLEFTVSGTSAEDARRVNMGFRAWAGPREDRPLEEYPGFINLRTVVWGFGLFSVILSLFALTRLDMLNVLLLLPSLLFSVSVLIGPFLMTPAPGRPLGILTVVPRLLGWLTVALYYTTVSLCAVRGSAGFWIAAALLLIAFGALARRALRYVSFRSAVRKAGQSLTRSLKAVGVGGQKAENLCRQILHACVGDPAKVPHLLQKEGVAPALHSDILALVRDRLVPLLRAPVVQMEHGILARSRFAVDYSRSFVLGLFLLMWFFLVPVPGLMVFTARSYPETYRFTLALATILTALGSGIGLVLAASWVSRFVQWLDMGESRVGGLKSRLRSCFSRLIDSPVTLTEAQVSSAFALLTDAQTYLEQRGFACARRSIEAAERILGGKPGS